MLRKPCAPDAGEEALFQKKEVALSLPAFLRLKLELLSADGIIVLGPSLILHRQKTRKPREATGPPPQTVNRAPLAYHNCCLTPFA
jgi:hypothetical protein